MPSDTSCLLSVIIPVYNRAHCIADAVESIQRQDFWQTCSGNYEIIAVDDGSSDDSVSVLRELAQASPDKATLRVIEHTENRGVCVARNTGIEEARGTYIAFLDSDDVWHEEKLSAQFAEIAKLDADERKNTFVLSYFQSMTSEGAVALEKVQAFLEDEERDEEGRFVNYKDTPSDNLELDIVSAGMWFGNASTLLAHRDAVSNVGPFVEGMKYGEDAEYVARHVIQSGKVIVVPKPLMTYTLPPEDKWVGSGDVERYCRYMLKHYLPDVKEQFGEAAAKLFRARNLRLMALHARRQEPESAPEVPVPWEGETLSPMRGAVPLPEKWGKGHTL